MLRYLNLGLGLMLCLVVALAAWSLAQGPGPEPRPGEEPARPAPDKNGQDPVPAEPAKPEAGFLAKLFTADEEPQTPDEPPEQPPQLHLSGLVLNQDGQALAIVSDARKPDHTRTLLLGSREGEWTVVEIGADSVVLEHPDGRRQVLDLLE